QLDVLVVDLHALALVDLLHLGDEVAGGLRVVTQLEHLDGGQRALVQRGADLDDLALRHAQAGAAGEAVLLGVPVAVAGRGDRDRVATIALVDGDPSGQLGERGRGLRLAGLEQLHHPRQAVGDVEAGHAAGVERAHRELGARLADRLRRDGADGVADLAHLAGRHRPAVAGPADADLGLALEHGAHRDDDVLVVAGRVGDLTQAGAVDLLALLQLDTADLGVGCDDAPDQARPVGRAVRRAGGHQHVPARAAVEPADDHVLAHVHEPPGQVARVGRAQGGVGEALAGAVRGDEVLQHRQPLHEVGLDRPLDDLALRIGHQAAHAGQLANLLERATGSGVGHHVDRVQLVEVAVHGLADVVGGLVPQGHDLLVPLVLGDEAAVVAALGLADLILDQAEDLLL